jgi:hypothetical protein
LVGTPRMPAYNCNKDPFAGLRDTVAPKWLDEVRKQYEATGQYRTSDMRSVIGDPARGVELAPKRDSADATTHQS